jgi:4-amino-4-deoxy-L-arabinose transferase-like glycosyltransferase
MRLMKPIDALRAALTDPARSERAVLLSLAAYMALWTLYGTVAKASQGLHPDMTEIVAWSRDLAWGYKHPPLAAAIVRVWFGVFPLAEWSYYLLAMLMPTLALWIVWRLSADYLSLEKRVAGLALMMFVPFFNFHALKFNVNTVLLPTWAATTCWFLRSYRTRSAGWAALAGFGAALCMLGKYWSVALLAGLVIAALIDRRRAAYFRSPAPWITVIVGLVALAPHLLWLSQHYAEPFAYAMYVHGAKPYSAAAIGVLGYLAGSLGYVAVPVLVVLIAAWPSRATIADMLWPADDDRRLAAAAFWGPLLLPALGALVSGTEITSLWSMSAWTLLPVLLLSPPAITLRAIDTRRILAAAVAIPLAMLLAAPAIAIIAQRSGPLPASAQAALLAGEVERLWYQTTPLPLRYVGGAGDLADGVATYAADRPHVLTDIPPPDAAALKRSGEVIVCFAEDTGCRDKGAATAATRRRVESEIVRNFLGFPGKSQRYTIFIVPPEG